MVTVVPMPLARSPREQVMLLVLVQVPKPGVTETKVIFAGRLSVSWTLLAGSGPLLITVKL